MSHFPALRYDHPEQKVDPVSQTRASPSNGVVVA